MVNLDNAMDTLNTNGPIIQLNKRSNVMDTLKNALDTVNLELGTLDTLLDKLKYVMGTLITVLEKLNNVLD